MKNFWVFDQRDCDLRLTVHFHQVAQWEPSVERKTGWSDGRAATLCAAM